MKMMKTDLYHFAHRRAFTPLYASTAALSTFPTLAQPSLSEAISNALASLSRFFYPSIGHIYRVIQFC